MASQMHLNTAPPFGGASALQPLRIWIVGKLDVVLPLERYGAQVHALDNLQSLYRELAIVPCDIVLIDIAYAEEGLAETLEHLRRREGLGIVLLVDGGHPRPSATDSGPVPISACRSTPIPICWQQSCTACAGACPVNRPKCRRPIWRPYPPAAAGRWNPMAGTCVRPATRCWR